MPPTATPGQATTVAAPAPTLQSEATLLFSYGKAAFDKQNWAEAVEALEKLTPQDKDYANARTLLPTAYVKLAGDLVTKGDNSQESAKKTLDLYNKALALDPANDAAKAEKEKAELYWQGRSQYDSDQYDQAVDSSGKLYNLVKQAGAGVKYRDTAELYYNCLVIQAGRLSDNKQWEEASVKLQQALKLDVPDKSAAQAKFNEVDKKLHPPTATPLPKPTPEPTPTSRPACSNFSSYTSGGTGFGSAPDQSKSNITGSVVDRNRNPIAGAVVRAVSGNYAFTAVTGGNGSYQFGGQPGKGVWTVYVASAPGRTICTSLSVSLQMNGQAGAIGFAGFILLLLRRS